MKKIISYNLNGIRAAFNKNFYGWLKTEYPDIICVQETKAQADQINSAIFENMGYNQNWHYAEKKGYSGVGILSKQKPDYVKIGMDNSKYDCEGRVIQADFGDLTMVCVYIPSGTMGEERQNYKMQFLADFQVYINQLKQRRPNLIVLGDFNICHKEIDINHPERHNQSSGFLPEEREWIGKFIENGFIDSFRKFNSSPNQYSWWSYRANSRVKNLGWRLDYIMVSEILNNKILDAKILSDVYHSDHCPVSVDIDE
ncbi:MAG: exodeoxyribonuclease III [Bacteroidota bacterium]